MIAQNKTKKLSIKKVLAFLTAVCMTVALLFPLMSVKAFAAAPTSYTDITADSSASVSITSAGSSKYFRFTPTQSGTYTFYSEGSYDTYGHLLDSTGTEIATNDDGGSGSNFSITYACTAGATYYVRARMYNSSRTGSYTLYVRTDSTSSGSGSSSSGSTSSSDSLDVSVSGGTNYSLFNSGATTTNGYDSYQENNPAPASHNNNGYDLFGRLPQSASKSRFRLGLSFTVNLDIDEYAVLSVRAWDVDEALQACGHGYEYDYIYLVDETAGTSVQIDGHLSGQNDTWNTTALNVAPELFTNGHTYHFELQMTCTGSTSCSYYCVTVRTVDLIVNGSSAPAPTPTTGIENAEIRASISSSGLVSVELTANSYEDSTFNLEYKALYLERSEQYGGKQYSLQIPTSTTVSSTTFQLESAAPRGTYEITVFIKDSAGNLLMTRKATASYGYSAVSYNPNGGSQNIPTDGTSYSSGDTVTVLFNNVPSKYGYVFLGWDTDRNATTPTYTANGNNTFTIGASDVTLYAIWASASCSEHTAGEWIVDEAPTATQTGIRHKECTVCHEVIETEVMPVLAQLTIAQVEASAGGTVRVTIDVQNNPGIIGAVLTLNYNSELTLVSAEAGGAWSILSLTLPGEFTTGCNFVWDGVNTADFSNGTIITLTFEVPDVAAAGTVYEISASYSSDNMINANLENVDVAIVAGCITVSEVIGDVNGDGVADAADVVTLRRYLAGGYNVTINQEAADMNGDGQITVADVVLLRRHLVA